VLSPQALAAERDRALEVVGRVLGIAAWPPVPLAWNRRLRRAGRAVFEARRGASPRAAIELSPAYFEIYPQDLNGILVHEAVHVGLALLGRPVGHGADFRRACERAGGLLHSRFLPGRVFHYRCPVCEGVLERRRRLAGDRWCAPCATGAARSGGAPFTRDRALVLVGLAYRGLDAPSGETPRRLAVGGHPSPPA
jgi:predicted SprT family Zn-dependent metalloprotease